MIYKMDVIKLKIIYWGFHLLAAFFVVMGTYEFYTLYADVGTLTRSVFMAKQIGWAILIEIVNLQVLHSMDRAY